MGWREGVWRWREREIVFYTSRYTVTTRMTPAGIKMGSDESHFNVSFTVRDKVTRQCAKSVTSLELARRTTNKTTT